MMLRALTLALALSGTALSPVMGAQSEAWEDIRHALYEERVLRSGADFIELLAPYRSENDTRTIIGAKLRAPFGAKIEKVTLILDDNPMPVSAVLTFKDPQAEFAFETTMRVNQSTPVHLVAEMTDGEAYVVETYVKTSGLGACSAPPGTDPEEALATLGQMNLQIAELSDGLTVTDIMRKIDGKGSRRELSVGVSHPSHSGMQKDQISLLFIPMRYVSDLDIDLNGAPFVGVDGSISLSENPELKLSVPSTTNSATVRMTDTDGTVTEATTNLRLY